MLKPVGALCNLSCSYCYYTEKSKLYPEIKNTILSEQLLEEFIQQYISCQTMPQIQFTWHGREALMRQQPENYWRNVPLPTLCSGSKKTRIYYKEYEV